MQQQHRIRIPDGGPSSNWANALLYIVALLILLPIAFYGCLFAVVVGPLMVNDVVNSGSATGDAAIERARPIIGDIDAGHARWRSMARNAKAQWTAPDPHGDNSEFIAFDLPPDEAVRFAQELHAAWSKGTHFRGPDQVKAMPRGSDDPDWIHVPSADAVYYELGFDTIGISRKTGRVVVCHHGW